MDEATASIDRETDRALQQVLKVEFESSTVLTIAHRLDTIVRADKVLVMGAGRVLEVGAPAALLADENSAFAAFARELQRESHAEG
jgi:ABC-type multidrug transport system fused ATPase/permease subunit